uniref:Odorant-binding protein 8 n=1 Tax=Aulacocentrum confusum TaxID=2767324 RepID=A0A7G8Z909_9HYME|nr:odorant-binding protein 8 [Aulacocentrum confusum]
MVILNRTIRMNFLQILIVSLVLIQTNADIRRDCREQTGVSWDALKRLKAADFNQTDHKLKCYLKCFMTMNGIFNEGDVDVERVLRHLPRSLQESSRTTLEYCKKFPSKDACDKAFQLAKCYFKFQPEVLRSVSFV